MDVAAIRDFMQNLLDTSDKNFVPKDVAIRPDLASMRMFDRALIGFAAASDDLFKQYREAHVVGPHFKYPGEWLPGACSVVSVFFNFTDAVKESNRAEAERPSDEWLHARIEGQQFIQYAMQALKRELEREGHAACIPSDDDRFESVKTPEAEKCAGMSYTSNWSERHVAFACGLGTFGLSAGLITKSGMAGRLGSLVTSLELPPTPRAYTQPFEYCTFCGICVKQCPGLAISNEEGEGGKTGKNHTLCSKMIEASKIKYAPRFACGKCQVAVPCQNRAPGCRA